MRSSTSSRRSRSRSISACSDFSVGLLSLLVASLICFLSVSHSIHADQIVFQSEKHSQRTGSQPILTRLCREFFHVAREVGLKRVESSTDVAALFFWQSP